MNDSALSAPLLAVLPFHERWAYLAVRAFGYRNATFHSSRSSELLRLDDGVR